MALVRVQSMAPEYDQALQKNDFKHLINYKSSQSSPRCNNNNSKRTKKRNIIARGQKSGTLIHHLAIAATSVTAS